MVATAVGVAYVVLVPPKRPTVPLEVDTSPWPRPRVRRRRHWRRHPEIVALLDDPGADEAPSITPPHLPKRKRDVAPWPGPIPNLFQHQVTNPRATTRPDRPRTEVWGSRSISQSG